MSRFCISAQEAFRRLPDEWPADLRPAIHRQLASDGRCLVVLDDDPTGTQTVHDVPVLTRWTIGMLQAELEADQRVFYILTNSRSFSSAEACRINTEVGRNLKAAAEAAGRMPAIVSRSDSTLRGHFPDEVSALAGGLSENFDAWLICPFFGEGGRYTLGDLHYVQEGERLVPAAETEFARDRVFGFRSSDLKDWVSEKTGGRIAARDVAVISIGDIRQGGPEEVSARLLSLTGGRMCVVNAASYRDLEVVVAALLQAETRGKRYLCRTAASFVRVRAGISERPLLTAQDIQLPGQGGGLVIVGSHVPRTRAQLSRLLAVQDVLRVEVSVEALLAARRRPGEIGRVAEKVENALRRRETIVVFTGSRIVAGPDAAASLEIGQSVSSALSEIVRSTSSRPRFILAKGGITSSDVATQGLGVRRAVVRGQVLPGVPVWQLGEESRFPGVPYIVFPGNVGDRETLARVVRQLITDA